MGLYKETNAFTREKVNAFALYLASDLYCICILYTCTVLLYMYIQLTHVEICSHF